MGLWQKIGRVFAGGAADATWLEAVQRQLVEADFGVAATNETVERLSRAATVDQLTLERIVVEQLGPPAAPLSGAIPPPSPSTPLMQRGTGASILCSWIPPGACIPTSGCARSSRRWCASWANDRRERHTSPCWCWTRRWGRTLSARRKYSLPRYLSPDSSSRNWTAPRKAVAWSRYGALCPCRSASWQQARRLMISSRLTR